jgi:hypothetical protein
MEQKHAKIEIQSDLLKMTQINGHLFRRAKAEDIEWVGYIHNISRLSVFGDKVGVL